MSHDVMLTTVAEATPEDDEFVTVGRDIRRDAERLRKATDDFGLPTDGLLLDAAALTVVVGKLAGAIRTLRREMSETALSYSATLSDHQLTLRGWAARHFETILDDVGDLGDRVVDLEGDTSQITASDADVLAKAVAGGKALAEQLLSLPEQTADGRAKLDEVLQACTQAEAIIEQARMEDEEEGEEDDGSDEEEPES